MKCVVCKQGETQNGVTTVVLERDRLTLVVKEVPAQVCENCGEDYVDEKAAAQLLRLGEELAAAGTQVEVRRFVAA